MTAVAGPFVFTSDQFRDEFVTKAKQAGCGAIALQLGKATSGASDKARAAGLQVIGWGVAATLTESDLRSVNPSVWMPQCETTAEFEALAFVLSKGVGREFPIEPVMTSGGMEHSNPSSDAEKVAEVRRRRNLLASYGINTVWVEVYRQDADKSGVPHLGDVNHMCGYQFRTAYGFTEARPVIGLWTADGPWARNPYTVASYDLSQHGRLFGAWRAEQMADSRYTEIAAYLKTLEPVTPPPGPSTADTRKLIVQAAELWEAGQGGPKPLTRITLAKRIASGEIRDREWKAYGEAIAAILDRT